MFTIKSFSFKAAMTAVLLLGLSACDKVDPKTNFDDNLVHYFPFSGNTMDEVSGKVYEAHNTSFLSDRKESPESSLFFNGFSSWMDFGTGLDVKEGTLSFWIFPCLCKKYNPLFVRKSPGSDHRFGSQYVGYSEEGKIETVCKGKWDVETEAILYANRWYHLVVRWNDAEGLVDIYVNAKKVLSVEYDVNSSEVSGGSGAAYVGKILNEVNGSTETVYYKGKLDEVRLYNKALPYSEIKELYTE